MNFAIRFHIVYYFICDNYVIICDVTNLILNFHFFEEFHHHKK